MRRVQIDNEGALDSSGYDLNKRLPLKGADFYQTVAYKERYKRDAGDLSFSQIQKKFDPSVAAYLIPFMPDKLLDLTALEKFLLKNIEKIKTPGASSTPFRKLACFYDWKVNGFDL